MSCHLRYEQCCIEDDCIRPARHAGLCSRHYLAASPAVRATADLLDRLDAERVRTHLEALADALQPTEPIDTAAVAECVALESLYELAAWDRAA